MWSSNISSESWYRASEAERARFQDLLRCSAETIDGAGSVRRALNAVRAETRSLVAASRAAREARLDHGSAETGDADPFGGFLRAAGIGDDDLPGFADDLIAAYRDALAFDDADLAGRLRPVLLLVGKRLASKTTPRNAGVTLN